MAVLERFSGTEKPQSKLVPVCSAQDIIDMQGLVGTVYCSKEVRHYIASIAAMTRNHPSLQLGVSTRGAIALIREEEELIERAIPFRVVFTRTSAAIATRIDRKIMASLQAAEVPSLSTHLHERAAYKSMFVDKLTLDELDPAQVNGLEAARENALRLALELVALVADKKAAA